MADPAYTTADAVTALAGQLAVDLRTDDADAATLLERAVDYGSGRVDFYCARYAAAELAANRWVGDCAAALGLEWLCTHRLNEVTASLKALCDGYRSELLLVLQGKAGVPRASVARRPATVTNRAEDLRRANNQTRVNGPLSTGAGSGYPRPADPTAPNQR